MRRINYILCGMLCLLLLPVLKVQAQEIVFRAVAGAAKMGTGDQMQIVYTIQGIAENVQFIGPDLKDFDADGPAQGYNGQIIQKGNQMVQVTTQQYSYVVHPKHTGTITIPPATIITPDNHVYKSNSLRVEVVNGSLAQQQRQQQRSPFDDEDDMMRQMQQMQRMMQQQMQQMQQQMMPRMQAPPQAQQPEPAGPGDLGKQLFLRVQADKEKVHLGEQVTVTYKLYTLIPMRMSISRLPSLNGFWTQDFVMPGQLPPEEEIINGQRYQVYTVKKSALFPQQTGTLTLDPAEAKGIASVLQRVKQRSPFADFFGDDAYYDALAYRDVPVHIKSAPLKITVLPLPENGKPADYGNAVGKFSLTGKMDKTQMTTDDAGSYTLTIAGSGNLKLITPPVLKLPNGLDTYDPIVTDTITDRTTKISGSKIIRYPIMPHTPGDYTVPAFNFSYYDPQTGAYATLHTEPVKIHVTAGKNYDPAVANRKALTDIHPIITAAPAPAPGQPMLYTVGYWSACAVPMLAFIGLLVWKRRDEELSKDLVQLKRRKANKIALKRLSTARKLLQDKKHVAFYEEVSKAIWLYLSDKLNIPLSVLSREAALEAMTQRQVPETLQQQTTYVVDDCAVSLYAPSGSSSSQMNKTYEQAIDVISKLEEIFK